MAKTIGAALKAAREARGFTLRQVAKATGLTIPQLSALEGGRPENPGWATISKVAKAVGASLDEAAGIKVAKVPAGTLVRRAAVAQRLRRVQSAARTALDKLEAAIDDLGP